MSVLAPTPQSLSDLPVPTILLNPAPRNERDALDFHQEFLVLSPNPATHDAEFPLIRNIGMKMEDPSTPTSQFLLPLSPVDDDESLPFLPSLNTPPPTRDGALHLEARGWNIHRGGRPPISSSPRDVVAESKAAYIHDAFGSAVEDKKFLSEHRDLVKLRRAWPLDEERDPSCTYYIEEAPSDTSSLSSSPWEFEGDTTGIFRMKSKFGTSNGSSEWPRSPVRNDADSQKALQMWIRSAPPLCVSTSDCSSGSSYGDDDAMSYAPPTQFDRHHQHQQVVSSHKSHHRMTSSSTRAREESKTADVEMGSSSKSRRLREALDLLIDVFTPECCAPHMRFGQRPGVLKPWHVLVPTPVAPQRQLSASRLRGCYL